MDFSTFEPIHEAITFYAPQNDDDKREMYRSLIKFGYISPDTTWEIFNGIFDKEAFRVPVEWIKGQRQLAYFVYMAFQKFNQKNLWIKGECCFRINGNIPHRASFVSGYSWLICAGWIDKYDVKLKMICNRFNHIEENTTTKEIINERPIHTSKCVFHRTKGDRVKRKMYSALIEGGYIAPETAFSVFEGIFDETKFKESVRWIKTQTQLMCFVHLAFNADNPFDVWVKCAHCFCLPDGTSPNRRSMSSNFHIAKKKGFLVVH